MGVVTAKHLYQILWAASKFSRNADPAADINSYLIANGILTPNVREDSGQPEGWRDYQQMLSELALIFSREVSPLITLTPVGLAYLDGSMSFSEVMTLQALRFQYPNGHHMQVSPALRNAIAGTPFAAARSYAELQSRAGVLIRPAVLAWRVLRRLHEKNSAPEISIDEFESYLLRCATNPEFVACADAIITGRDGGIRLPRLGDRQRRNSQDWFKFLRLTKIFTVSDERRPLVTLSAFGTEHATEIDAMCKALENPAMFWRTENTSQAERLRWYGEFGGVDLALPELPQTKAEAEAAKTEFVAGEEQEDERIPNPSKGGRVRLREFRGFAAQQADNQRSNQGNLTIQSVYNAEITQTQTRLHDQMVLLIAETCRAKGAAIFDDPDSVDLLIQHQQREFIVEVKSVTPRNFVDKLRYALGQVLHYDFLRSVESQLPRRQVVAFAANVPHDSWSVRFVNEHLNVDMLSLESGKLQTHSPSATSIELFGP